MIASSRRAVSPVVAVILMVAVTVVLSATVGLFVLDLGQGLDDSTSQDLGVRTTADGSTVTAQVVTGEADELRLLVDGSEADAISSPSPGDALSAAATEEASVTVIAVEDGEESVVSTRNPLATLAADSIPGPTDGLVSYWTFDDETVSGDTVADTTSSYDGTINGPTTGVSGVSGEAFAYDTSTDDNVRVEEGGATPVDLALNTESHTVVGWFRVEGSLGTTTNSGDRITGYMYGDNWRYGMWVNGDTIRVHQSPNNGGGVYKDFAWTQDNEWHMIGQVYDAGTGTLKVIYDGSIYDGTASSFDQSKAESGLYFGRQSGKTGFSWNGDIDEMRVYDRALSASEVQNLYDETQ